MTCQPHFLSSLGGGGAVHPEAFQQQGERSRDLNAGLPEILRVSINLRAKFWNLSSDLRGGGCRALAANLRRSPVSIATQKVGRSREKRAGYPQTPSPDSRAAFSVKVGPASASLPKTLSF